MNIVEATLNVVKDEQSEVGFNQALLEEKLKEYFMNKEIAKERNEENKLLLEVIEQEFEKLNGADFSIELPSGEYGKITKKASFKEVLDKDILANKINQVSAQGQSYITKDDLKTPWDFSMLTKQDRITPKMISECTTNETVLKTRVSKVKNPPK
jgi:hypothetical protein